MIFDFVGMFFPEMIYGWIAKGSFGRWIITLRFMNEPGACKSATNYKG
jgi:hypothetical protein